MPSEHMSTREFYRLTAHWLGENYVQILIAVAIAIALIFLLTGLKSLIIRTARRMPDTNHWPVLIIRVVQKTRLWFLIALSARIVDGYSNAPATVTRTVAFLFVVAAVLQTVSWVRTFILELVRQRAASDGKDSSNLASAIGIIELLVSAGLYAIAAIVILDNLGVNVTGLVAGLGIGGIAIGLAAQGIFSDLFAALSIIFDKPFQVGDAISYTGKEGPVTGTVEEIGLKSTRIRALSGELRIIGNAQLLAQEVTNFAGRSMYRLHLPIGITYQTPPDTVDAIPQLMEEIVSGAGGRFVRADFAGFASSSINFNLYFDVDGGDFLYAQKLYQAVAIGVLRSFKERDIAFAYPTQTNFLANPDGQMVAPFPEKTP